MLTFIEIVLKCIPKITKEIMEGNNDSSKKAKIISLQDRVVNNAVETWYRGNRERNTALVEEASHQLEHYRELDMVAKYFAGAANIQLRDDDTEKHLAGALEALEGLIKESKFDNEQLLKSSREMLKLLTEVDEFFPDNYEMPLIPSLEEVFQVLSKINKCGLNKGLLAELYAYLNAYLGR